MIRMTKQTDYGIRILTQFATTQSHGVFTARDAAVSSHIPLPMVSKILKMLAKHGMLTSIRGVKGGYRLAKTADQISVAEIIQILEGPISLMECTSGVPGECRVEENCPVRGHWWAINHTVQKALEGLTIQAMVQPAPSPVIPMPGRV